MNGKRNLPVVLGGVPTWAPDGPYQYDRWDGTAPSFDAARNAKNPNAVSWPQRDGREVQALARVGAGDWAYNGPFEVAVRRALTQRRGVRFTITTNNGSDAIKVALGALLRKARLEGRTIRRGSKVITTATSFSATPQMIADMGLTPVLVDPEPGTLVPSVAALEAAAIREGAVGFVPVALYAAVPDLAALRKVADRLGMFIHVDAAHAPFGQWDRRPFAYYADTVSCSYQLGKDLTCGEGGDVNTNDPILAALADAGRNVGTMPQWAPRELAGVRHLGRNSRMAEPQAALLGEQLARYDAQAEHRMGQWGRFIQMLNGSGLPFRPLDSNGSGFGYKLGLYNRTNVPTAAACKALREQFTGEVNQAYPALCDPQSGWVPQEAPTTYGDLPIDYKTHFPNAHRAAARLLMISHDFFLREDAAEHLFRGLKTFAEYEPELVTWARTLRSS
jgi:dTDP-4-amino-4,6-dideoxygalactose transaminase